jgi:exodeoxyribonuclease-5
MDWSSEQNIALEKVAEWLKNPTEIFRLFGYAGTGKTTLAKHFAKGINGQVLFGAYTGKAALVLQEKGCFNASTIHRLIYLPKQKSKIRLQDLKNDLMLEEDPIEIEKLKVLIEQEEENLKRPCLFLEL